MSKSSSARDKAPLKVLVVGQTPPPHGGQSVMVQALLQGHYTKVELHHVRLAFSDDMDSVGKFAFRKVTILFTTILAIWRARVRTGARVLYYPPSGPNMVPVLRDIILLNAVRWAFRATVFHFHAGGVSDFGPRLPFLLRPLFRSAYGKPRVSIRTAASNPDDGRAFGAVHDMVVANGVPDQRGSVPEKVAGPGEPLVVLFTGVLIPSKGVRVLLEAFRMARDQGVNARLELMGRWGDAAFEAECIAYVAQHGMEASVQFLGVKRDREKLLHFAACDIFCFPSHFEAESFGLVLVEAMQFAKPLISTHWRGIPTVAQDGVNAILTPVEDPVAVADALVRLAQDPELRQRMGREGRRIFEERFTLERFHRKMEEALALAGR